ncbi:hypothetical protein PG989_011556 [Apiospora arundinis]
MSRKLEWAQAFGPFIWSMHAPPDATCPHDDGFPATNAVGATGKHSRDRHGGQSSNGVSHGNAPLDAHWFRHDLALCIKQYPSPISSMRVLDVLVREDRNKINTWRDANKQGVLFVSRPTSDESASDWTTDLTLEIMDGIIGQNLTAKYRPVVAHFCKQNANKKDWGWGGIMVQDFIAQLRDHQPAERSEQSSGISPDTLEDPAKLWALFEDCLINTKAKTAFVFLDNVDCMFDKLGTPKFWEFFDCLEGARERLKTFDTTIKVMVTCSNHSPAIEEHFKKHRVPKLDLHHPPSERVGTS